MQGRASLDDRRASLAEDPSRRAWSGGRQTEAEVCQVQIVLFRAHLARIRAGRRELCDLLTVILEVALHVSAAQVLVELWDLPNDI